MEVAGAGGESLLTLGKLPGFQPLTGHLRPPACPCVRKCAYTLLMLQCFNNWRELDTDGECPSRRGRSPPTGGSGPKVSWSQRAMSGNPAPGAVRPLSRAVRLLAAPATPRAPPWRLGMTSPPAPRTAETGSETKTKERRRGTVSVFLLPPASSSTVAADPRKQSEHVQHGETPVQLKVRG